MATRKFRTTMTLTLEAAQLARVFAGGASNMIDAQGQNARNPLRDPVHKALSKANIAFYDPQVHPDTHGETYQYEKHGPIEQAARAAALPVYEVSPITFCGVTSMEIAMDHLNSKKSMVVWFSNGVMGSIDWPAHDDQGFPLFTPLGLNDLKVQLVHLQQMVRNANSVRRYFLEFARQVGLPVTFEATGYAPRNAVRISQSEMHVVDMLQVLCAHLRGEKVAIHFYGPETTKPVMDVDPALLSGGKARRYLSQYIDEGNAMRREVCKLLSVNVRTRVVFTDQAAIDAVFELLELEDVRAS